MLDTLNAASLSEWEERIDALQARFGRVREYITRKMEPRAHRLKPAAATLKTREEVDEYLEEMRAEILRHVDEGRPVIF